MYSKLSQSQATSCPCYTELLVFCLHLPPPLFNGLWSVCQLDHCKPPQWVEETLVCRVSLPSHTTGSVANTLLLRRALGPRCVCRGRYPTCLSLPCNGEESNHLATSLCLEIELRPEEQGHINHKRIHRGADHTHNSVRTTSRHYFTSEGHQHLNPQLQIPALICPSLSFNMNQTLLFLFHFHHYLSPVSFPPLPLPLFPFSCLPVSLHAHLLSTIDNIPDGAPLLATHRQINQSNNTPINSNYAEISPGRALLGAGIGGGSCRVIGCFSAELQDVCLCIHLRVFYI